MPVSSGVYTLPWTFVTRFAAGDTIPRNDFDSLMSDVATGINGGLSAQTMTAWDASTGAFPSGAGTGKTYYVTAAGTIDSMVFGIGDVIYALKDAPSTTTYTDNWRRIPRESLSQTRAQLKAWIGAGNTPRANAIYPADGRYYIGSAGATSIPDMPGLLPFGDLFVEHMGAAGDGSTDDTNPFQYAINYLAASGGVINLRPVNYSVTVGSLSVGAKQVLWRHDGATINGATTPDMPGIFSGFDPAFGRFLHRVDRANQATGQPFHWFRQHHASGSAIGPVFRIAHFLENGSLVNGINPATVLIDQEVTTESSDMGSNDASILRLRSVAKAGIDGTGAIVADLAVSNSTAPSSSSTAPGDDIITRIGKMTSVGFNVNRSSAWNDEGDSDTDRARVFNIDARGGGEAYAVIDLNARSAHIHPWSGVAVGGTGTGGDPLVLPNETTFSQTDNTWFTAQSHWVFFDKESGYNDPVTLYKISSFTAASRELVLDTALPVDAAGKRISIVGVYAHGVVRNFMRIGQYSLHALSGVTLRNTSGSQLSEIVSTSNYKGPVFDYSGATLTDGKLFALPSDNTVDLGVDGTEFRNVFGSPVLRSYTAANIADVAHAVNTTGKVEGKVVYDTTNRRLMVARGSAAAGAWDVADGSVSVTPS